METININFDDINLTQSIESVIRARLGPIALQSDFRRSLKSNADAAVVIRAGISKTAGRSLEADFERLDGIEAARYSKQKLFLRFSEHFLSARMDWQLACNFDACRPFQNHNVLVAFCDPNANKALHVGHLRNIAIGNALASLWETLGADVQRQSVVCDIGRNIAESIAGLIAAGAAQYLDGSELLSPRLGALYAKYVADCGLQIEDALSADAPIVRELARHDDEADRVLDLWRSGDQDIHAIWKAAIARVMQEQAHTLSRLGVVIERNIPESNSIQHVDAMIEKLKRKSTIFQDIDGSIVLETGRSDYARCVLARSDGFPTEHLRALILWDSIRGEIPGLDRLVHVMGQEWRTSTEIRLELLDRLQDDGAWRQYELVPHQVVRTDGSDMKSSHGNSILIDDLCDAMERYFHENADYGELQKSSPMIKSAVMAPMLNSDMNDIIDVSFDLFFNESWNPGLRVARALAMTRGAEPAPAMCQDVRFMLFQAERLTRMIETAAIKSDPRLVVRHLIRLADNRLEAAGPVPSDALLRLLLMRGARALGWAAR
ncbi:arginine--tRNA ligase domain-containing protein [Alkalicaulis satelles]|nr:arginine--tRNA ligase [Alkalicaulis satelles]